jgi:glycosyltransferase involved in cell wall biosynthesis
VRRIHALAWRDLDDPDAGGSEGHADELLRRWAAAGFQITQRTSAASGRPAVAQRNGYQVVRRGSRYSVFARSAAAEVLGRYGRHDALVEVWNGVPWLSPLWCRRPRITIFHHVHGAMWDQIMPRPIAGLGRFGETRLAPPLYRRTATVTPSEGTRQELLRLGFRPELVTAIENGVDAIFTPGGPRSPTPLVLAVGRFAPVKRFELAIDAAVAARRSVPNLTLRIVGDGPLRDALTARTEAAGASGWIELTGRVSHETLRDHYRSAWVVLSASLAEGWGLTLTEAAACGTPAVATDISGHRCSVVDGETGVLAPPSGLADALTAVLTDHSRRKQLGAAALARAQTLSWEATATGVLAVLHAEVMRRAG